MSLFSIRLQKSSSALHLYTQHAHVNTFTFYLREKIYQDIKTTLAYIKLGLLL